MEDHDNDMLEVLATHDADGDGSLSFHEFSNAINLKMQNLKATVRANLAAESSRTICHTGPIFWHGFNSDNKVLQAMHSRSMHYK